MAKRGEVRQYRGYRLMWQYIDKVWDILYGKSLVGKAGTLDAAKKKVDKLYPQLRKS